jgi:hypothetical protein
MRNTYDYVISSANLISNTFTNVYEVPDIELFSKFDKTYVNNFTPGVYFAELISNNQIEVGSELYNVFQSNAEINEIFTIPESVNLSVIKILSISPDAPNTVSSVVSPLYVYSEDDKIKYRGIISRTPGQSEFYYFNGDVGNDARYFIKYNNANFFISNNQTHFCIVENSTNNVLELQEFDNTRIAYKSVTQYSYTSLPPEIDMLSFRGAILNPDGNILVASLNANLYSWSLDVPWDLSSANTSSMQTANYGQSGNIEWFTISEIGHRLNFFDPVSNRIRQVDFSTLWDITSGTTLRDASFATPIVAPSVTGDGVNSYQLYMSQNGKYVGRFSAPTSTVQGKQIVIEFGDYTSQDLTVDSVSGTNDELLTLSTNIENGVLFELTEDNAFTTDYSLVDFDAYQMFNENIQCEVDYKILASSANKSRFKIIANSENQEVVNFTVNLKKEA